MNLKIPLISVLLLALVQACSTGLSEPPSLEGFDLSTLEQREEFLNSLAELVSGQEDCRFSDTLLARITFGHNGFPRKGQFEPKPEACVRGARVTEIRGDTHDADIFLSGKPHDAYYVKAVLQEEGWFFYWPEPIGVRNPVVF